MAEWIGLLAGFFTTVAFVPQVLRTYRSGRAEDFSLPMLLMFVAGVALWLAYGLMARALPMILANAVTLCLASYILIVKVRHG